MPFNEQFGFEVLVADTTVPEYEKDGKYYIECNLYTPVSYNHSVSETVNGEVETQTWPVTPYVIKIVSKPECDGAYYYRIFVDGMKIKGASLKPGESRIVKGFRDGISVRELLFSMPRFATDEEDRLGEERITRVGLIEVECWCASLQTSEWKVRKKDLVFTQANKKDSYSVTGGQFTMATSKAGRVINPNSEFRCVDHWRRTTLKSRLSVAYRMGAELVEMGFKVKPLAFYSENFPSNSSLKRKPDDELDNKDGRKRSKASSLMGDSRMGSSPSIGPGDSVGAKAGESFNNQAVKTEVDEDGWPLMTARNTLSQTSQSSTITIDLTSDDEDDVCFVGQSERDDNGEVTDLTADENNTESANAVSTNVESANIESTNVESANAESACIESANIVSINVELANAESTNAKSSKNNDESTEEAPNSSNSNNNQPEHNDEGAEESSIDKTPFSDGISSSISLSPEESSDKSLANKETSINRSEPALNTENITTDNIADSGIVNSGEELSLEDGNVTQKSISTEENKNSEKEFSIELNEKDSGLNSAIEGEISTNMGDSLTEYFSVANTDEIGKLFDNEIETVQETGTFGKGSQEREDESSSDSKCPPENNLVNAIADTCNDSLTTGENVVTTAEREETGVRVTSEESFVTTRENVTTEANMTVEEKTATGTGEIVTADENVKSDEQNVTASDSDDKDAMMEVEANTTEHTIDQDAIVESNTGSSAPDSNGENIANSNSHLI